MFSRRAIQHQYNKSSIRGNFIREKISFNYVCIVSTTTKHRGSSLLALIQKNDGIVATVIAGGIHNSITIVRSHPLVTAMMKSVVELAKAG
jgi:hypothetical protein